MEIFIPTTFDNYTERKTWRGIEKTSTTFYKGHKIFLKTCAIDGIYCVVTKIRLFNNNIIAQELYSYIDAEILLKWAKNMIDARGQIITLWCCVFHKKFHNVMYSSIGKPIINCLKCKK